MQRLFFALWPNTTIRERLINARDQAARDYGGRPTRIDKLHITLSFIGEVADLRVPAALACGDRVRGRSFAICIDMRAHFNDARVAWLGCADTPPAFLDLRAALLHELDDARFSREDSGSGYLPHVTVARNCQRYPPPMAIAPIEWPVEDFVLVASTRAPTGHIYRVLRHWPLDA